jgi:homogentisate 1,2-dioxygenase
MPLGPRLHAPCLYDPRPFSTTRATVSRKNASGSLVVACRNRSCPLAAVSRGHGPDAATFDKTSAADTSKPHKVDATMAFMFVTRDIIGPTAYALATPLLQKNYHECWSGIRKHFKEPQA